MVSAKEWAASARRAEDAVTSPPIALAMKMVAFAAIANHTVVALSLVRSADERSEVAALRSCTVTDLSCDALLDLPVFVPAPVPRVELRFVRERCVAVTRSSPRLRGVVPESSASKRRPD
jgi:hypothetical protein